MTTKVVGVFLTDREAYEAIEELKRYGYAGDDISVIAKNREEAEALSEQTGTKAPEGAAGGAAAGGLLGGVGGLLAGIGALAIPGIGPLLAAGPIATTLAGIAVGATGGGLVGGLIGLGIPEEEARGYDKHVGGGRLLVIVDSADRNKKEIEDIFRRHYSLNHTRFGADENPSDNLTASAPSGERSGFEEARPTLGEDRAAFEEERTADRGLSDRAAERTEPVGGEVSRRTEIADGDASERDTLQLRAEQLEIDKHWVQTGEVQVRKEIIQEEKTITVPVTREEVVIERRAVDGGESDGAIGRDETIRIPVSEERIDVEKHNVVTEEIEIGKRRAENNRHIEETVKREEARVDRTGHAPVEDAVSETARRPAQDGGLPSSSLPDDKTSLPPRSERFRG